MFRSLIFILALLCGFNSFAQSDNKELLKTFEDYFAAVRQKDNNKTLDFIYPKLFTVVPRATLFEAMESMYADTTSTIGLGNPLVTKVAETIVHEGVEYTLISYTYQMTLSIKGGEGDEEMTDLLLEQFKEMYGEKNVSYDPEKDSFTINIATQMYAVKEPSAGSWKFLEKKESMQGILETLFPEAVLKKL